MRIKTFGAKHFTGQLPRIEEGFRALGHQILDEDLDSFDTDLIYINDPNHFPKITDSNPAFKILNIQDIPHHLDYNLTELEYKLSRVNKVTSISETTRNDLKKLTGFDSTIIYQPVMPIHEIGQKKYVYKYLIVGRNSDPNKRNRLAAQYLRAYEPAAKVAVVGSEDCFFGDYFGVVSNETLNDLYNSAEYVFSLTKYGGIELSQIEAILAGKFPIVANDSDVAMEFNPEFACEPTAEGIHKKIIEIEQNPAKYKQIVKDKQSRFAKQFSSVEVARKILELV